MAHNAGVDMDQPPEPTPWLLQLPGVALGLMLQKLDQCSLASAATSCRQLGREVPAYQSSLVVRCRPVDETGVSETYDSFSLWLARHSTSLRNLVQCSIVGDITRRIPQLVLHSLPCPQLRQLQLRGLLLQLEPDNSSGCPGVLYDCSSLTALDLQGCALFEVADAFTAIAALPELQHLTLETTQYIYGDLSQVPFAQLQQPSQLTYLSLQSYDYDQRIRPQQLEQLSAMVNLQHLHLGYVPNEGVPGGLPSQLQKLTCLEVCFSARCDVTEQLQHLSSLTALQQLSVDREGVVVEHVSGIRHLPHLTHLQIRSWAHPCLFIFSTISTSSWACLTRLQSLELTDCIVQPAALARLTKLRALSLRLASLTEGATLGGIFEAVSRMSLLTQLDLSPGCACPRQQVTPAAAFTALTASTHLCDLQLNWPSYAPLEDGIVFFKAGREYPHLRRIKLQHGYFSGQQKAMLLPLSEQQIEHLCNSCPAVKHLEVELCRNSTPTALLPLAQLSALTHLKLSWQRELAPALGAVAQLTGLKQLFLQGYLFPQGYPGPLLQLTALTALEELVLKPLNSPAVLSIQNKARWCSPSDVGLQLLRKLNL